MNGSQVSAYDYGQHGRIGVAVPQANPTVEAEFAALLPRTVSMQVTRLVCASDDPHQRLTAYIEELDRVLASYASMPLDAFGFACTGSSYLIGAQREGEILDKLTPMAGYPLETAARAVLAVLRARKVSKLALVAPYPQPLLEAAIVYWREQGLEVVATARVARASPDTTSIYALTSQDAAKALQTLPRRGADAILLSGTGMPTLACIRDCERGEPILSSNQCLAWRLLALAGAQSLLCDSAPGIVGWRSRLAESQAWPICE